MNYLVGRLMEKYGKMLFSGVCAGFIAATPLAIEDARARKVVWTAIGAFAIYCKGRMDDKPGSDRAKEQ